MKNIVYIEDVLFSDLSNPEEISFEIRRKIEDDPYLKNSFKVKNEPIYKLGPNVNKFNFNIFLDFTSLKLEYDFNENVLQINSSKSDYEKYHKELDDFSNRISLIFKPLEHK